MGLGKSTKKEGRSAQAKVATGENQRWLEGSNNQGITDLLKTVCVFIKETHCLLPNKDLLSSIVAEHSVKTVFLKIKGVISCPHNSFVHRQQVFNKIMKGTISENLHMHFNVLHPKKPTF